MAVRVAPRRGPVATRVAPALARLAGHWAILACAVALLVCAANLLSVLPRKSLTTDEYVHIPAGVAYLHGDFRPNAEHPPLAKMLAALPLVALGVSPPPVAPAETPTKQLADAARYFWEANAARFAAISFWARVPMVALTVALGALLFAFARSTFGDRAAAFAVALFALEPTILAHGRVVHTDTAAALGLLGVVVAGSWYARCPGARRAAALGLALGLMFLTKFSLLTLAPVIALLWAAHWWRAPRRGLTRRNVAGHAALAGLVALAAINACYGLQRQPLDPGERAWVERQAGGQAALILGAIDALGRVLPPRFLFGVYQQYLHTRLGHPASVLGDYSLQGWWYYFPVAYALKTPLPLLGLSLGALAWALWRAMARREGTFLWVVGPLGCYLAVALTSRIDIGIRHLLPLYPFLLILAGAALDRLWGGAGYRAARRVAVVAIVGWLAIEAALAYPDYIPYLNQLARREPGWALLSDSNVEWGDDLGALARYLRERGETAVQGALLGGGDLLIFHGITYVDDLSAGAREELPVTRYVAIGASYLNGSTVPLIDGHFRPDRFAAYRGRRPEAVLGGSIYLFRNEPPSAGLDAALPDPAFRAAIRLPRAPSTLRAGESSLLRVELRNESGAPWPAASPGQVLYQVRLGNYWLAVDEGALIADDARAPLPYEVAAGASLRLYLLITAPAEPGEYWLDVDLVQEGVTWFGARGSTPARVRVRVVP